jgi:spermidine synthase
MDFSSSGGCLLDVIMFDVDSKDSTVGMSCPPSAFVETSFLEKVRNLLTPKGMLTLLIFIPNI